MLNQAKRLIEVDLPRYKISRTQAYCSRGSKLALQLFRGNVNNVIPQSRLPEVDDPVVCVPTLRRLRTENSKGSKTTRRYQNDTGK